MDRRRLAWGLLALVLPWAAPSHAADEAADAAAPRAGFEYGRLRIDFPQAMQTWENARRDDVVRTVPDLRPSCYWSSDTQLDCRFAEDAEPAPATRYRIDIAAGLKTQAGEVLPTRVLHVETPRPEVQARIGGWAGGVPAIVVASEVPLATADLAKVLRLEVDGRAVALPGIQARDKGRYDDEYTYVLAPPQLEGADRVLALRIVPGLRSSAGPLRGEQDGPLLRARVREPLRLRTVACAGRARAVAVEPSDGRVAIECAPGERIQLATTPLDGTLLEAGDARLQALFPPGVRVLDAWPADDGRWRRLRFGDEAEDGAAAAARLQSVPPSVIELRIDAAGATTRFTVGPGLADAQGRGMAPVEVEVRTSGYRPHLRAARSQALLADGEAPPVLVEAIDAPPVELRLQSLGVRPYAGGLPVRAGGEGGKAVPVDDPATRGALAEGGWVRWSPPDGGRVTSDDRYVRRDDALQFAAPAFDLFALAGRREVLAWANGWDDGRAVAGAEVELFWLADPERAPVPVARGRTGADGVALLRLPEDFRLPDDPPGGSRPDREPRGTWLVRAAGGDRLRAVLPLDGATAQSGLGSAPQTHVWGVTDRPLYRAGDRVRYRLWQRQRDGMRLRRLPSAGALTLRLIDREQGKTIRTWQATPDGRGGMGGELELPVHLTDSTYCIGEGTDHFVEGSCFFVGTWRAQDLWAQVATEDKVLRDGDRFEVDLSAGYYSGGPAAGLVSKVSTLLSPLPLEEAYPQWSGYTFVDVYEAAGHDGLTLAGSEALAPVADREGKARIVLPVRPRAHGADADADADRGAAAPAFGRLSLVAEIRPDEREATASNAAQARYARYARYVGLRSEPAWFGARGAVALEGIVIDADGRRLEGTPVEVEVHYLSSPDEDDQADTREAPQPLARCTLRPGRATPCDFPRERSGWYRLTARSADAAPAQMTRYVWAGSGEGGKTADYPSLEVVQAPARPGDPVRVLLKPAATRAQVLYVFASGGRIMGHQVATATGAEQPATLRTEADWDRSLALGAWVRDASGGGGEQDGYRQPVRVQEARATVAFADEVERDATLALSFEGEPAQASPGAPVRIVLRNGGRTPREVVLAVVDDALRALASDYAEYFDPAGRYWLGKLDADGSSGLSRYGYQDWNATGWRLWLPWAGGPSPVGVGSAPDGEDVAGADATTAADAADAAADAAEAAANAAATAADAATAGSEAGSPDVPAGGGQRGSPGSFSAGEPTPLFERNYGWPGEGAADAAALMAPPPPPSPPAPMADRAVVFDEPSPVDMPKASLDSIVVTGSRATPEDAFAPGQGRDPARKPPSVGVSGDPAGAPPALARLRTRFAATALWEVLELAPGETRVVALSLPDNLTRWRALAWHNDGEGDFALAESTLATGLPLEVRLQAPVRIYPGDTARLAANLRQAGDAPRTVRTELAVSGAEQATPASQAVALAPRGQGVFALDVAPRQVGTLSVTASARADGAAGAAAEGDAVAAMVEVASPYIDARRAQLGWLGTQPLALDLPALPAGSTDAHLHVSLLRGGAGLVERWTQDMRAYPHRCWEQILSRAVAAALALRRRDPAWPEAQAQAVVREALDNAPVFQGGDGALRYFAQRSEWAEPERPQVALTAYTVRAFERLRALGFVPPEPVERRAREFLDGATARGDRDERAFALAASERPEPRQAAALWRDWERLGLPARLALAEALARVDGRTAAQARARVLSQAAVRGEARVLGAGAGAERWMGSDLREQCTLIEQLRGVPEAAQARGALLAGLTDLYAGGFPAIDTQAGATCLWALRDEATGDGLPVSAEARVGEARSTLALAPGQSRAHWSVPAPTGGTLRLEPVARASMPSSYVAELRYREDARQARPSALGLAIDRRYEVLRDGDWRPVEGARLREGDWLRVSLTVDAAAPRHFVAVTDQVPGGLQPTDLALGAIAGLDLERVSDEGSHWFATRKLDPRSPRFYAETLPAGRHVVHYFARVGNAGDYLAAPATAEPMYGNAVGARSAAARLRFETAEEAQSGAVSPAP